MPNTKNSQSAEKIFHNQPKLANEQKTHGDVWQDKSGTSSARVRLTQPAPVDRGIRSRPMNSSFARSQNSTGNSNSLVPLHLWVRPILKSEVQRQAQIAGLSTSATGASLLEEITRQKIHVQQAATLETVIGKSFEKTQRTLAKRLVAILIRIAFDTGQTRVISTNILGRTPGMTEDIVKEILQMGDKRTKANLTRRTTQLKEFENAIEKFLLADDEEGNRTGKEGRGK
jgi:hypothetical protein